MMTRRRTTVSIYDYPEHLNPFREDIDDGENVKYHTTGRRRSSFRVNAWSVFAGRGKSPEGSTPSPVASRFLTWTPKLLRRASLRRAISPTAHTPAQPASPRILPARPPAPTHNCTPNSSPAPVPAVRTRRHAQRAGVEEESKYVQQGAKPKKKRRAPDPPTDSPTQQQEPETSGSSPQVKRQESGETECGTSATAAEGYVKESSVPSSESEATEVTSKPIMGEMTERSKNSLTVSEETTAENGGIYLLETSGKLPSESRPAGETVPQDNSLELGTLSQGSPEQPVTVTVQELSQYVYKEMRNMCSEPIASANEAEASPQDAIETVPQDISLELETLSQGSPEQPVTITATVLEHSQQADKETRTIYSEATVNGAASESEAEASPQYVVESENTKEHMLELQDTVEISAENTPVIVQNSFEEPLLRTDSSGDIQQKDSNLREEEGEENISFSNGSAENGFRLESEHSSSKSSLIDEGPAPLPKPRTILPEKPAEQDKKP